MLKNTPLLVVMAVTNIRYVTCQVRLQVQLQPKLLLELSNQEFIPAFWEDDTTSADAAAVSAALKRNCEGS